ncbi:serine/threonine-protein kinase haspin homolog [Ixodes scapularis]|uniref:serine/threonine-protein kinase haspin homolog n=1 Tax=Ixodes scapularis TaxID=6945 RepID=UPI001AD6E1B0|nr:serine/threonine-protein kinase haspin homolog [Ixodes scapularis]
MYYSRKNFSLFGEDIRDLYRPYFVMYMSFAGQPLAKAQFDSALQLRSVIEQVAMTLAVGETAFQFEHRGLTSGHILVKPSNDQRVQYCIMRNSVFVELHGIEASIVDFSMSRMCLTPDAEPLYSDLHRVADAKRCAEGESFFKIYDLVR